MKSIKHLWVWEVFWDQRRFEWALCWPQNQKLLFFSSSTTLCVTGHQKRSALLRSLQSEHKHVVNVGQAGAVADERCIYNSSKLGSWAACFEAWKNLLLTSRLWQESINYTSFFVLRLKIQSFKALSQCLQSLDLFNASRKFMVTRHFLLHRAR